MSIAKGMMLNYEYQLVIEYMSRVTELSTSNLFQFDKSQNEILQFIKMLPCHMGSRVLGFLEGGHISTAQTQCHADKYNKFAKNRVFSFWVCEKWYLLSYILPYSRIWYSWVREKCLENALKCIKNEYRTYTTLSSTNKKKYSLEYHK